MTEPYPDLFSAFTEAALADDQRLASCIPSGNHLAVGPAVNQTSRNVDSKKPGLSKVQPERIDPAQLLEGLNEPQHQAVIHEGCPVLVVAGAGSGKTRVLTRRIAYLVSARSVRPSQILAITFTNKAANEMRERVADLIGESAKYMWVSTFHSACVRILRSEIEAFGYKKSFTIYDDADSKKLVELVCKQLEVDVKRFSPKTILNRISKWKSELVTPGKAVDEAKIDSGKLFANIYQEYQSRLKAANALDFDDLLMMTVQLLQDFPQIRQKYRAKFRQVLIDEYQDTNYAQYCLVRQLCLPSPEGAGAPADEVPPAELMVVGDSDQSIYAFRGATIRNILDFERDFPGARTILLEQNYRSSQTILSAANAVIKNNAGRMAKNLWSSAGDGEKITGWVANTERGEAQYVVDQIDELVSMGKSKYSDIAVFYRTNGQSRIVEDAFVRTGIPYKVVGGVRFYDRKEIKDIIAYLKVIANPDDDVSVRRIINVPKRGIGDKAIEAVAGLAAISQESFYQALGHCEDSGIGTRAINQIKSFVEFIESSRSELANLVANEMVESVIKGSGYLDALEKSTDPQDKARIDNLSQLVGAATDFVAKVNSYELLEDQIGQESGESFLTADSSLGAFLEQISLASDTDQIPDAEEGGSGVVTLMTLHSAKGLEFDTVFLTGMEEDLFPHSMSLKEKSGIEEERRLAYVGITRARKRLFMTSAASRAVWGRPEQKPASRFLAEIPADLIEWKRSAQDAYRSVKSSYGYDSGFDDDDFGYSSYSRSGYARSSSGEDVGTVYGSGRAASIKPAARAVESFEVGDRVLHATFGMGKVLSVTGVGDKAKVDVDFGSEGSKRLLVKYAPMEKL